MTISDYTFPMDEWRSERNGKRKKEKKPKRIFSSPLSKVAFVDLPHQASRRPAVVTVV